MALKNDVVFKEEQNEAITTFHISSNKELNTTDIFAMGFLSAEIVRAKHGYICREKELRSDGRWYVIFGEGIGSYVDFEGSYYECLRFIIHSGNGYTGWDLVHEDDLFSRY